MEKPSKIYYVADNPINRKYNENLIGKFFEKPPSHTRLREMGFDIKSLFKIFEERCLEVYEDLINEDHEEYADWDSGDVTEEIMDIIIDNPEFFNTYYSFMSIYLKYEVQPLFYDIMVNFFESQELQKDPHGFYGVSKKDF